MKKLLLTLGILICSNTGAQNVVFDWAKQIGGTITVQPYSMVLDGSGNIYNTGAFEGTADFDPGTGTTNLTAISSRTDVFISKYNNSGGLLWAKSIGSAGNSFNVGNSIGFGKNGDVYVVGTFQGTMDFDPSNGIFNLTAAYSPAVSDVFVLKLNSSGDFQWAKRIGGNGADASKSIKVDKNDNLYILGGFAATVDFDPGINVFNLVCVGQYDLFVLKLNSMGDFKWVKQIGGSKFEVGNALYMDKFGSIFMTGYFTGTADFDPGSSTYNLTPVGLGDIFISKLDSLGGFIWANQFGGLGNSGGSGNAIYVDDRGNVLTTGIFKGVVDFDPGSGTYDLTSTGTSGLEDIYISKLNSLGKFVWAKQLGGNSTDIAYSITGDAKGNVFSTGTFYDSVDFNPGPAKNKMISNGGPDIYVLKLDSLGLFQWVKQVGGVGNDYSYSILLDGGNNVYSNGMFAKSTDFDPGNSSYILSPYGQNDQFIFKWSNCKPDNIIDSIIACGAYKWTDGKLYTTSNNTAIQTLLNKNGCDSTVRLNLTLLFPNERQLPSICAVTVDSASSKNIVVWEKQGLNRATKYYIYRENTSSQFVKIGTVHRDSLSTFVDTGSYPLKQSYSYKVTLKDSCGQEISLDSVVAHKTVHLTSNVGLGGEVNLIWNLYEGKSYTSHNIMRSANGGAFVKIAQVASNISAFSDLTPPSGSLVYKISLSSNVCRPSRSAYGVIQSNPVFIRPSAVNVVENLSFSMYPNPASSVIEIQSQNNFSKIEILDIEGRMVKELVLDTNSSKVDVSGLCVGVYFVKVTYQGLGTVVQKILID